VRMASVMTISSGFLVVLAGDLSAYRLAAVEMKA
jgi:hypothetical protein